jgi:tetratricopeptide (TPR) repeat protein
LILLLITYSLFSYSQFIQLICSIKSELRCLSSVYVYCDEGLTLIKRIQLETWARTNEPLITGIYSNSADCFAQLAKDVNDICDHDSIPVTYLNFQIKNFNLKQANLFLIFHLFLQNILFRLSSTMNNQRSQRTFRSCLYYYRDNEKHLEEINHFQQHYNPQLAIDWYLRTKFLSRLLHKASRTQNLALLFDYSFIFNDIQHLMEEKSTILIDIQQIEIYYRAQNLNADDLYRLRMNLNGIISINRYLDLCKNPEEAVNEVSLTSNTLETVLYHFSISHSYIPISDTKILLSIGTLFRIQHIGMEIDGIWHVHLNIMKTNDINDQIQTLMNEIDFIPHPYLSIGLIWDKLKQSAKADRFYRFLIERLPKQDNETALICNYVGAIFRLKCQYTSALNYHQQALIIYKDKNQIDSSFTEDIHCTYAQIALVYRDMGDVGSAIEYFKLALKQGTEVFSHLAEIYRNLGQFHMAHEYYQQAKIGNNIGLCYIYQRMFPEAFSQLQKETNYISYINSGIYYQLRKEYGTSLVFFDKALEAVKNHPLDTAMIHSYLGLLHCDRRQWLLSLKHYQQALDLYKCHLSTNNHPTIALIHDGLGTLYLNKGEFRAAQHEFERCLELQLRVLPSRHPDIAGTYNNLGGVFNEMGHYEQALLFHYEAFAIATVVLPDDHVDIKLYEHNITETKRKLA